MPELVPSEWGAEALRLRNEEELSAKAIAEKLAVSLRSLKNLFTKENAKLESMPGLGSLMSNTVVELVFQPRFQAALHGYMTTNLKVFDLEQFSKRRMPLVVMPPPEPIEALYPLGSCKLVATIIGTLCSPFSETDKFENSASLIS
ncbi:unnamed protein product [Amoebophrya sp. A25]|nr:unnamed protein product [Amoebophrya sp. A25]|eukprot:GSA25T00012212001.1